MHKHRKWQQMDAVEREWRSESSWIDLLPDRCWILKLKRFSNYRQWTWSLFQVEKFRGKYWKNILVEIFEWMLKFRVYLNILELRSNLGKLIFFTKFNPKSFITSNCNPLDCISKRKAAKVHFYIQMNFNISWKLLFTFAHRNQAPSLHTEWIFLFTRK
jgi:hypothetical protein